MTIFYTPEAASASLQAHLLDGWAKAGIDLESKLDCTEPMVALTKLIAMRWFETVNPIIMDEPITIELDFGFEL